MSKIFNDLFKFFGEQLQKFEDEHDRLQNVYRRLEYIYKTLYELDEIIGNEAAKPFWALIEVEDEEHDRDMDKLDLDIERIETNYFSLKALHTNFKDSPNFKKLTKKTISTCKIFETKKKYKDFCRSFENDIADSECYLNIAVNSSFFHQ